MCVWNSTNLFKFCHSLCSATDAWFVVTFSPWSGGLAWCGVWLMCSVALLRRDGRVARVTADWSLYQRLWRPLHSTRRRSLGNTTVTLTRTDRQSQKYRKLICSCKCKPEPKCCPNPCIIVTYNTKSFSRTNLTLVVS